ncbi:MAG: hypothetical protein LKG25_07225 [Prevotella sp.]|jgi:N-acetylglucosamine kinase-like BadF-type ATPase|nr:hypothetical protein [Prevotella sp.]MCI1282373.1 hypothetical protein [Prevotella sp.]
MNMIADSSSTKTDWAIVEHQNIIAKATTAGINPFFQTRREISRVIRLGLPEDYFKHRYDKIYYYGAGCNNEARGNIVKASLTTQFRSHTVVESDLLAAARSLFNNEAGIACILGTGSNSCYYDGENIQKHVRAGGYIFGDEGSAAALGKMFLSDYVKGLIPEDLAEVFMRQTSINPDDVLTEVYNKPLPNRFLAQIGYFLADYVSNSYVEELITKNLRNFFTRNVCQYQYQDCKVRFVGLAASKFAIELRRVAKEFDIEVDEIRDRSMEGLIYYHALIP